MIEYVNAGVPSCLVVKVSGKLSGAEYKDMVSKVDGIIQENGSADLVVIMQAVDFPEWEAIKADAHFGMMGYQKVRRAAFVGDSSWMERFVQLMSPFTRTEERLFHSDQLNEAVLWASGSA